MITHTQTHPQMKMSHSFSALRRKRTKTLTVDSSGDARESLQSKDDKQSGYSLLLIT